MIGIYGGSFDPPHKGHLGVIQSFWKCFPECKKLLLVPNYISPFKKKKGAKENNLLEMLHLLVEEANIENTHIEEYEIHKKTSSYTIETIEYIRSKYQSEELFFLMGIDSLTKFSSWKDYEQILEYSKLIIFDRAWEKDKELPIELKRFTDRFVLVENPPIQASSSQIRNLPQSEWSNYLTPNVLEYILENKLYQK